jgi:hypothetical protein
MPSTLPTPTHVIVLAGALKEAMLITAPRVRFDPS